MLALVGARAGTCLGEPQGIRAQSQSAPAEAPAGTYLKQAGLGPGSGCLSRSSICPPTHCWLALGPTQQLHYLLRHSVGSTQFAKFPMSKGLSGLRWNLLLHSLHTSLTL